METVMHNKKANVLVAFRTELEKELESILSWWLQYTIDKEQDGFYGSVNNDNIPDKNAHKGIVLNSRICWSFSAAYQFNRQNRYSETATKAFQFILEHFIDKEYDGAYWSVNAQGGIADGKKQIYGLAFCIYGFTEFYKISKNEQALQTAIDLFECIEKYSFDKQQNGYIEAFTREWQPMEDLRLSEKDNNERKTMNTHLHIIEAYANLYSVWSKDFLKERIMNLLDLFDKYFINKNNFHLDLFYDDSWKLNSRLQSFGHDIEASWLLQQCAEITGGNRYIEKFRELAIPVADAALEGLSSDGGLWYEYDSSVDHFIYEKHSWPQAEAMVGFFNTWQLTGNDKWLHHSLNVWEFIKKYIRDTKNGEWFWGVNKDYSIIQKEKAGFWKCPYHASRACLELIKRIDSITNK